LHRAQEQPADAQVAHEVLRERSTGYRSLIKYIFIIVLSAVIIYIVLRGLGIL
jgi:hypothetical protein